MRNANAQCQSIMILADALQQLPTPHVSHAETGEGQVAIRTASVALYSQ